MAGGGPFDDIPDRELGGFLHFAAPHSAPPAARAVDVAAQAARKHAAVHGGAAIQGRLRGTALGVEHAVVIRFAIDAGTGGVVLNISVRYGYRSCVLRLPDLVESQPPGLVDVSPVDQR